MTMSAETSITKEFVLGNEFGLHARPAALFVKCASRFKAEVTVGKDGMEVSGKSIMGLLTLEGHQGSTLTLRVTGEDSAEAMQELAALLESNFGE